MFMLKVLRGIDFDSISAESSGDSFEKEIDEDDPNKEKLIQAHRQRKRLKLQGKQVSSSCNHDCSRKERK